MATNRTQTTFKAMVKNQKDSPLFQALPPIELNDKVGTWLDISSTAALSQSCLALLSTTAKRRHDNVFTAFLKAAIHDKRETVKRILDGNPHLLLTPIPQDTTIKTLSHQVFYTNTDDTVPLVVAKLGQIEMLKLMRPYFNHLPNSAEATTMLAKIQKSWPYQYSKSAEGKLEINIPEEYMYYANALVDAFVAEPIPNNTNLSGSAQSAFLALFNILLPKKAVSLDDYLHPELFLIALMKTQFSRNKIDFRNFNQIAAYYVRLIGLTQSILPAESIKIILSGFIQMMKGSDIKKHADNLMFNDEKTPFYPDERPEVDSTTGAGFDFFCDFDKGKQTKIAAISYPALLGLESNYINQTQQVCQDYPDVNGQTLTFRR